MASHAKPPLSTAEALHLYCIALPRAISTVIYTFVRHTLREWLAGNPTGTTGTGPGLSAAARLKRRIMTSVGPLMTVFSVRELQCLQKTTGDAVRTYAAQATLPLASVLLSDADTGGYAPATLHLLDLAGPDRKNTSKASVMLYFHGGAYIAPLQSPLPAHILARRMGAQTLAILEYGLAPACAYPTQLAQAVAALRYLVDGAYSYASVVVVGESAGANLALALLAHMQAPHPGIAPLPLPDRLLGLLAMSARTQNTPARPSHAENEGKDMISQATLARIAEAWQPAADDVWASPGLADRAFWRHARADHILLTAGGDEIYRDDIVHTAAMLGAGEATEPTEQGQPEVELVVCPGEVHVQAYSDMALRIEGGAMTKAVLAWADKISMAVGH